MAISLLGWLGKNVPVVIAIAYTAKEEKVPNKESEATDE